MLQGSSWYYFRQLCCKIFTSAQKLVTSCSAENLLKFVQVDHIIPEQYSAQYCITENWRWKSSMMTVPLKMHGRETEEEKSDVYGNCPKRNKQWFSVHSNNNNRWCSVVYRVFDQRRLFWHTKEKFRNTKRSWLFLIFLQDVKITPVGLKLDGPQLQHWSLFSGHNTINRLRS